MAAMISCRTGMFGNVETAFEYFPKADVFYAECPPAPGGDYPAMAAKAKANGVTIASLSTQLHLDTDEQAEAFRPVIDGAAEIGVPKIFVSAKASSEELFDEALERLGGLAKYAASKDVAICMETHPPFAENGDKARLVIERVGSPGLRFNFDTANIYYYNEGCDSVAEVRKVAELVGSVHLKDTDGGYKSPNFPPVGQGIVDFPAIFAVLEDVGFQGPYTLEIEGAHVSKLDTEGRLQFLKDCVAYLRSVGVMD
jgi:sugar phosphate isomerase/epimerase